MLGKGYQAEDLDIINEDGFLHIDNTREKTEKRQGKI